MTTLSAAGYHSPVAGCAAGPRPAGQKEARRELLAPGSVLNVDCLGLELRVNLQ